MVSTGVPALVMVFPFSKTMPKKSARRPDVPRRFPGGSLGTTRQARRTDLIWLHFWREVCWFGEVLEGPIAARCRTFGSRTFGSDPYTVLLSKLSPRRKAFC